MFKMLSLEVPYVWAYHLTVGKMELRTVFGAFSLLPFSFVALLVDECCEDLNFVIIPGCLGFLWILHIIIISLLRSFFLRTGVFFFLAMNMIFGNMNAVQIFIEERNFFM